MVEQLPPPKPTQVTHLGPRIQAFLESKDPGLAASCLRYLMVPVSAAYGTLSSLRLRRLNQNGRTSEGLPIPVISIGNLVVGGTGKTPFVRMLCEELLRCGERPIVLGRGYGAKSVGSSLDEEGASLVRDLTGVVVAQGRDRFLAAMPHLSGAQAPTVAVLDDGAQALRHRRDLDIHLIDARRPFGSGWPLPAGSLREWRRGHARADILVATRSERLSKTDREHLQRQIKGMGLMMPLLWAEHRASGLNGAPSELQSIEGRKVYPVSGIARPQSFIDSVTDLGAEIVGSEAFSDHHDFSVSDIEKVEAVAKALGAEFVVTTGKDSPKVFPKLALAGSEMQWISLDVRIYLSPEDRRRLGRALDELLTLRDHAAEVADSNALRTGDPSS